jgi:predicted MFS family arabinose efflux permease
VSVGVLYFANTLGAALGAALTGFVALYYLGLTSTIYTAALLNIGVSAAVWRSLRTEHV